MGPPKAKGNNMKIAALTIGALAFSGSFVLSTLQLEAAPLAAWNGMTLYVFDKDAGGVPSCYDKCAALWPPAIAKEGQKAEPGWTTVKRKDGTMQWAYDNRPVYFYAK